MQTVTSTFGRLAHVAVLGATLQLAACGSNWGGGNPNVSIGGTVSGLSGGSVELWLNGGSNTVVVSGNGSFSFPLELADGSQYAVIVGVQPAGQTCTVANGEGTASRNVNSVTVSCERYRYTQRPLPSVYGTAKAVNYSPYRTLTGPIDQEVPTDAQILQDLSLLDTAGYSLLRLFGAAPPATDVVAEKILQLAAANYPDMKFQLGISLHGLTSCSDPVNDQNIFYLVTKLSKYPNVAAISVGNETSFYSKYMPVACLERYIRTIRSQVTQPVTADDDFTFYAGLTYTGGDRVEQKPDTILALIDFASIHMYPISNPGWWNWQQTGVAAGPARAKAMMEAALAADKDWYGQVAGYHYVDSTGTTVTTAASMPIVIGETGWKAVQTNPASEIEQYTALQVNAKWYDDLLYGNPSQGYASWEGSVGGPASIFWFEATDEQWKQADDGWGLWDADRNPRYALCGTPAGPACNTNLYEGAGYYDPSGSSTFDGTWASNYAQVDVNSWTSIEGGEVGVYIDGSVPTEYWWNGVAPGDSPPNFYFGYGINANNKPWGFGTYVKAPGNSVVGVGGYTNLAITVWGNPELMNTHPNLTVVLRGPTINACAAEVVGTIAVTAAAPQSYTLPLAGFAMQTPCAYANVADVLTAGLAEIHIQVLGPNVQYVTPADASGNYANGLNVGPITFN
jgi:hypothetical protein